MKRLLLLGAALAVTLTAFAALSYNQTITTIYGSGNVIDTGWTAATDGGVQLAARGKDRETGVTDNVDGNYNIRLGYQIPPVGTPPSLGRAYGQFDISVNSGSVPVNTYTYYFIVDTDPSTGVGSKVVVNLLADLHDNSYGTSATGNGQGVEPTLTISQASLEATSTVVQQSHNLRFYGIDPTINGTYTIELYRVAAGAPPTAPRLGTVSITLIVGAGGPTAPDVDEDGVPDYLDDCDNTPAGYWVNAQGCSIQKEIDDCEANSGGNVGEFRSCVAQILNDYYKQGHITKEQRAELRDQFLTGKP